MKDMMICLLALCFAGNTYALDNEMVEVHGFLSQGYLISTEHDFWYTDAEEGTFQFNEIGLNVTTEPVENLRMGVQLLSRDLGKIGNNEVKIDWAYGDYYYSEWLGLRVGIMKRPCGLYNQSRDIDAARTWIFLPSSIYPEAYRDWLMRTEGIGIYGTLPGNVSYEIQYGTFSMDADGGIAKIFAPAVGGEIRDINTSDVTAFGLQWDTPLQGLTVAGSGFRLGDIRTTGNSSRRLDTTTYDNYFASVMYEKETFTFVAEYRYVNFTHELGGIPFMDDLVMEGYYASTVYRLSEGFELGLGYSIFHSDQDDRDNERKKLKDLFLSTRFDLNDYWIFKLEGHYMDGLYGVTGDLGDDPSDEWFLFAAKTTISF